jgi:hypothetical protein
VDHLQLAADQLCPLHDWPDHDWPLQLCPDHD